MRRQAAALGIVLATAACSYIFELPEEKTLSLATSPLDASDGVRDSSDIDGDGAYFYDGGSAFCPMQTAPHLFCADFDDDAGDPAAFGTVQAKDGFVQVANVIAVSPPHALLASVTGTDATATVLHPLGASPERIRFSSNVVISAWSTPGARLMDVAMTDGGQTCTISLSGGQTNWSVTQVCSQDGVETGKVVNDTGRPIERRRWRRFTLILSLVAPKTVAIDMDDYRIVEVPALDAIHPAPTSVALGVGHAESGTATVFHDNVLVTAGP